MHVPMVLLLAPFNVNQTRIPVSSPCKGDLLGYCCCVTGMRLPHAPVACMNALYACPICNHWSNSHMQPQELVRCHGTGENRGRNPQRVVSWPAQPDEAESHVGTLGCCGLCWWCLGSYKYKLTSCVNLMQACLTVHMFFFLQRRQGPPRFL